MTGKSHYRVRGVNCGKCDRIHTWYKYRVWRDGDKIKEEYVGKCDREGNMQFDRSRFTHQQTKQDRQQPPPNTPLTSVNALPTKSSASPTTLPASRL